jgi:hypothetical protein
LNASFDDFNPDQNLHNNIAKHDCRYFSPHSFDLQVAKITNKKTALSFLHNNVRSLKKNLENLQNHLLSEFNFQFNIIGVSETRIVDQKPLDFNPDIPCNRFEYVPTPLSAGGVGMYIMNSINYRIIDIYFQALWIEFTMARNQSFVCGVVYRQHNDPTKFLDYLSETLYNFNQSSKTVCIMGDFNIDLLKYDTCTYSKEFLHYLYSSAFFPTISKPTRIYGESATLIDNIILNKPEYDLVTGNIVSDISDHYTQVRLLNNCEDEYCARQKKNRDYSKFDQKEFLSEVQSIVETVLVHNSSTDVTTLFNRFYKMLMKIVNKHAPLKPLSKRKEKQLSKPWITNGIRRAIKIKNKY